MCKHLVIIGDNYGDSCADCGEQLSGYGYGGFFGINLTGQETCFHTWSPIGGEEDSAKICIYCETIIENTV